MILDVIHRKINAPGEIRKDYEIQKAKEELELQKIHEAEAKASEAYIQRLKENEERERLMQEKNLRLSEQVARQLALELFDVGPSTSKTIPTTSSAKKQTTSTAKKQRTLDSMFAKVQKGTPDRVAEMMAENEAGDSNDSINSECRYFKPIAVRLATTKRKVHAIRVPAIVATASTVIIG